MSANVETTVRQWSTPVQKVVEGRPPNPEDHPTTLQAETRRSNIRTVTPSYKSTIEQPGYELKIHSGSANNLTEAVADYKVRETQDHYKLQIIDPKVKSNANMPTPSTTVPAPYRSTVDFPSEHSRRSFLKLEPMEQRRMRSVETRPITTSAYLTESLDRHRQMEASRLKEYLKAKEGDANKPWNKPDWPGPKAKETDQSLRELEEIKKTIEALQKAAAEGPRKDVSSATWQFSSHSFSPRSVVSINGGSKTEDGLLKVKTDLSPGLSRTLSRSNAAVQTAHVETEKQQWPYMPSHLGPVTDSAQSTMTREFNESYSKRIERYASLPTLEGGRGTLIKIKDEKPRGIMKRRELETKDQMMYADEQEEHPKQYSRSEQERWEHKEVAQTKPKVTETVQKFEEHTRTEEIERRIQRKEKKEKKHRSEHRSYHRGGQEMIGYTNGGEFRSGSLSRHNGYIPSNESYTRTTTTRREREGRYADDGRYYMANGHTNGGGRYGSVSDSLRRGDMKYIPNGDVREIRQASRDGRVHKSYSTRDVFDSGTDDFRTSSYRRGSQQGAPYIEFPPTLPRVNVDHDAPVPPPHRGRSVSNEFYKPLSKSRSYADWDDGRGFGHSLRRRDEDMARLESEFRDSLLMPLPKNAGNMYERDHRHENIPGGYETFDREAKSSSGLRMKEGHPTQFSEASQEYSYKREIETDGRR